MKEQSNRKQLSYSTFLLYYEGEEFEPQMSVIKAAPQPQMIMDISSEDEDNRDDDTAQYFTSSYESIHVNSILSHLNDNSVFHAVTGINVFNRVTNDVEPFDIFTLNRYSNHVFQGIMPNIGAAGILTTEIH